MLNRLKSFFRSENCNIESVELNLPWELDLLSDDIKIELTYEEVEDGVESTINYGEL